MAAVENVAVIDTFSQFDVALQGPDGLHPSAAGYARMAEIVFERIKALYEQPAAAATPSR
jgi:lysophospholipase L1-like esterase